MRRGPGSGLILVLLGTVACGPDVGGSGHPEARPISAWAAAALERLPELRPCGREPLEEDLLCGTFQVPEDHGEPDGRQIELSVVVVPAETDDPPHDPVWIFEGGPGGAATRRAVGSTYAGPVRARDIVLADQRGTGDSSPIDCDLSVEKTPGVLREMFPEEPLRACIRELTRGADLLRYTSTDHARDVEWLRRRLGYGQLNLRGGSYGSRAAMVYAQLYPEQVRTLFAIGVDSPLRSNLAERGLTAAAALDGLDRLCSESTECRRLGPLKEQLIELFGRLQGLPRSVTLDHPLAAAAIGDGPTATVDLTRGWLSEQVRLVLYFAFSTRALPFAVERAHDHDDWLPLTALALTLDQMFANHLSTGVALTVQCSEGMDFDIAQALRAGTQSPFGNRRLEQQRIGCGLWPHRPVPPLGIDVPLPLEVPTLFLSGAFDPVTPPSYAVEAQTLFPVSRHVVFEEGQHGPFDLSGAWECVHQMWADLLDGASIEGLDTSCSEGLGRPTWVTEEGEFWRVLAEEIAGVS